MSKVITGSRGRLFLDGKLVGIFESVTYNRSLDTEPVYILGSATPKEITPLNFSPVQVNCNGFRLVDNGPVAAAKFPKLQDFLNITGFAIEVIDRVSGKLIMKVKDCIPTTDSGGYNSRATSRISVSYIGLSMISESGDESEVDAVELP